MIAIFADRQGWHFTFHPMGKTSRVKLGETVSFAHK